MAGCSRMHRHFEIFGLAWLERVLHQSRHTDDPKPSP